MKKTKLRNRGWTVYAIAQEMGVSEGTVNTRSTKRSPLGLIRRSTSTASARMIILTTWCAGMSRPSPRWR
jgi:predicted transcriptional regulator